MRAGRPTEDCGRSRGYPYQPVLIGDLRAKGHVLEVHCNTCAHFVELDPKTLPLDDRLPGTGGALVFQMLSLRIAIDQDSAAGLQ